jgi:hypothetical protein
MVKDMPSLGLPSFESGFKPAQIKVSEPEILERYWNDIYKLFINRLTQFDASTKATEEDKSKLKALLNELIYVKTLLVDN